MKKLATIFILAFTLLAVPAKANKSPWSQTIGENYQLTDCKEADRRIIFAMKVHDLLLNTMHDKLTDEGMKQVLLVEVRALYEYVIDLRTWKSDNCSEA